MPKGIIETILYLLVEPLTELEVCAKVADYRLAGRVEVETDLSELRTSALWR